MAELARLRTYYAKSKYVNGVVPFQYQDNATVLYLKDEEHGEFVKVTTNNRRRTWKVWDKLNHFVNVYNVTPQNLADGPVVEGVDESLLSPFNDIGAKPDNKSPNNDKNTEQKKTNIKNPKENNKNTNSGRGSRSSTPNSTKT